MKSTILKLESQGEIIKKEERIIQTFQEHFMNVFGFNNTLRWPGGLLDGFARVMAGANTLEQSNGVWVQIKYRVQMDSPSSSIKNFGIS